MKRLMKWTMLTLGGLVGLFGLAGLALYPIGMKKLTHSYPGIQVGPVEIPTGSEAIARGRHIAVVWGCTKCHTEDLSGKLIADDPILGTIPASNLTSGNSGVGGSYTDADWVRAIRHGVKPVGRSEIFMNDFSTMSDQDLGDLLAYLKQIQPVDADFPALRYGPIVPITLAVGVYTPAAELIDHAAPRPADPAPGATIEYGEYLSTVCSECHGKTLAGKLDQWTQEDFIAAFQTGALPDGKQLNKAKHLTTFGEMNDTELIALWLYFLSTRPLTSR